MLLKSRPMKLEGAELLTQRRMAKNRPGDEGYGSHTGTCPQTKNTALLNKESSVDDCGSRYHRRPRGCPWSLLPPEAMLLPVACAAIEGLKVSVVCAVAKDYGPC